MAARVGESAFPVGAEGAAVPVSAPVDVLPPELAPFESPDPPPHPDNISNPTLRAATATPPKTRGRRGGVVEVSICFSPGPDCLQPLGQIVLVAATPQDQCGTTSGCEPTATLSGPSVPGWATVGTNRVLHWHVGGRFTLPRCRSNALLVSRGIGTPGECATKPAVEVPPDTPAVEACDRRRPAGRPATGDGQLPSGIMTTSATPRLKGRLPWHPRTPIRS